MKISKKNLMSFARNHAYGEEVLGKGTTRLQTINSFVVEFMFGEINKRGVYYAEET